MSPFPMDKLAKTLAESPIRGYDLKNICDSSHEYNMIYTKISINFD